MNLLDIISTIAVAVACYTIGYMRGRNAGIDETLDYFNKHPLPLEWLEKK